MTLAELRVTNPQAVENWLKEGMGGPDAAHDNWDSCSVQPYEGSLFLVWNNGCYMEPLFWTGTEWQALNYEFGILFDVLKCPAPKWYEAGGQELVARGLN